MTPELGERFEYQGSTYVVTQVYGNQDEVNALVHSEYVSITAKRLDLIQREVGRLNALLDAHEVDQRADS